jgi:hypothetical protein
MDMQQQWRVQDFEDDIVAVKFYSWVQVTGTKSEMLCVLTSPSHAYIS